MLHFLQIFSRFSMTPNLSVGISRHGVGSGNNIVSFKNDASRITNGSGEDK